MTKYKLFIQRFAEAGGDNTQDAAGSVVTNEQDTAVQGTEETFEDLIGKDGKYKEDFNRKVNGIISRKFKDSKKTEERLEKMGPILDAVSAKYGIDVDDIDGLVKAVQGDDSLYEAEALEQGMSVKQYREMKQIQAENQRLKSQQAIRENQMRASAQVQEWQRQAEAVKADFPDFDFQSMIQVEQFQHLLKSGVDVRNAYIALNADDILSGAMAYTAKEVQKKTAQSIAARNARPSENGFAGQAAAASSTDVSKLTNKDIEDLVNRAAHGEKITF